MWRDSILEKQNPYKLLSFFILFNLQVENVINYQGIRPYDLAIDPYSRVLFYSCSQNNVINFTHIDSETRGTVVKGNHKPRYIALNPEKGQVFSFLFS